MIINSVISSGGGSAPEYYVEKTLDANNRLINGASSVIKMPETIGSPSNTYEGYYVLAYAYYGNQNLTGMIDLSNLKAISGYGTFFNTFTHCKNTTGFDFSNLERLDFVSALSVFESAFYGCTNLSTLNFDKLCVSNNNAFLQTFQSCPNLTTLKFYSLKYFAFNNNSGQFGPTAFNSSSGIQQVYFPALRPSSFYMPNGTTLYSYLFNAFLSSKSGVTMHFPSNLDPAGGSTIISSLTGYPNFGGTNTVLAFDLPATVELTGANSQVYERSPKDDTNSALAWRKKDTGTAPYFTIDWTPYYTSGTTDPAVSDTIYSDAACTTAVTTISSIA